MNEYIAWQLVTGYSNDTSVKAYLDSYDFYIIPVVNPDGESTASRFNLTTAS